MLSRVECSSLEVSCSVRQRGNDIGRPVKDAEGMVVTEDWHAVRPCRAAHRERPIVINVAVVVGPSQVDCIEMQRSNDVGPRRKVLAMKRLQGTRRKHRRQEKFEKSLHPSMATAIRRGLSTGRRMLAAYTNPFPIFEKTRELQLSIARTSILIRISDLAHLLGIIEVGIGSFSQAC